MKKISRVAHIAMAALVLAGTALQPLSAQAALDMYELADYRLTTEVFERFTRATNRIEEITRDDASFKSAPLFTKNAALSGNPVAEATGLVARLEQHAALAASLQAAKLTPREYAKFALGLVAAHLAYDLVKSGVLLQIPSGAPAMNIEFMKTHESAVIATLVRLGIRD